MKKKVIRFFYPLIVLLVWFYVKILFLTCKIRYTGSKKALEYVKGDIPILLLTWHGRFLIFPNFSYGSKFAALVSAHRDGDILSKYLNLFKVKTIKGSSRRGALSAVKGMMKGLKDGYKLVITPDGPLGPRFKVKGSIINIAAKTKTPLILACYSATKVIKLKTWDRFIIPLPFTAITIDCAQVHDSYELLDNDVITKKMVTQMKKVDKLCNLKIEY